MVRTLTQLCLILVSISCFSQQFVSSSSKKADSLFFDANWKGALAGYNALMNHEADLGHSAMFWSRVGYCYHQLGSYQKALESYKKSEANNPSGVLQPILFERFAKTYLSLNDEPDAYVYLDKAVDAGYLGMLDLDTAKEFKVIGEQKRFKDLKEKMLDNAYPCRNDSHSREFDFWVGDWNAYVTGTNLLAGHSLIQKASGDCMILENWTSVRSLYEGKSLNFVDPATNKWEQVWVGAEGRANDNVHRFFNGQYKDSVMRFDFETTDTSGKKLVGRFSFYNQGANQVRQLNETSADGGKTWSTVYDFTYKRKK